MDFLFAGLVTWQQCPTLCFLMRASTAFGFVLKCKAHVREGNILFPAGFAVPTLASTTGGSAVLSLCSEGRCREALSPTELIYICIYILKKKVKVIQAKGLWFWPQWMRIKSSRAVQPRIRFCWKNIPGTVTLFYSLQTPLLLCKRWVPPVSHATTSSLCTVCL